MAVVPFVNVSQRTQDEWIGAGIAETVATDLQRLGWSVLGQATVVEALMAGKAVEPNGAAASALSVYAELGVRFLVSGTFQRLDDLLRITAGIVDVRAGAVLHIVKIDGTIGDLFATQDRIAATLADRLAGAADQEKSAVARHAPALATPPKPETIARELQTTPLAPTDVTGVLALDPDRDAAATPLRRAGGSARPMGGLAIGGRPTAVAIRTSEPPAIDGRLDDAVWMEATPITDFVQTDPVEGAPGTEQTEVWIAYDSDNLYFAFYAHYTDPRIIRANRSERDAQGGDDQMSVLFDPFLDQQRAYQFSVNGYGVAGDSIVNAGGGSARSPSSVGRSSSGSTSGSSSPTSSGGGRSGGSSGGHGIRGDRSWDALFETRGGFVEDGWTAEMAIPFKSLRYPARPAGQPHRWGFQISRNIREKSESLVWSPVLRDAAGQLNQMGVLEGLTDLSTSRNLEILPTFTAVQAGALDTLAGRFRENDTLGKTGVDIKYGVTSNLTMNFTYHPDFSQIESDRPQVDVNQRFALFYQEQRPFFLEGQEIFATATPLNLIHTRTIVDPRFGAKLTGKVGNATIGVFITDDEAPGRLADATDPSFLRTAQSLIGRFRYDLYAGSYVGMIATAREFGTDYNRVGGVDGRFRLGRTHSVSFAAVGSDHQDASRGQLSGPALEFDFTRQARHLSYGVSHSSIDPDFRSETGFVPRVDIRRTDANVGYRWWPEGTLISWGPSFAYLRNYNHAGVLEDEQFRGDVNLEFALNRRFSVGLIRDLERFGGINFRKTGYYLSASLSGPILSVVGGASRGDGILFGENPFLGQSTNGNVGIDFRPTSRLWTELRSLFSRFVNPANDTAVFDVKIYRWRATYQFTDRLLIRHIMEHNTFSGTLSNNVLFTYRINAGTVAFLGYDDRYQRGFEVDETFFPTSQLERTNRAFFTKISYLFRF